MTRCARNGRHVQDRSLQQWFIPDIGTGRHNGKSTGKLIQVDTQVTFSNIQFHSDTCQVVPRLL